MPASTPLHCRHPRELGLEEELTIAEDARSQGDWKHALHHYVNALGMEPLARQATDSLRRLAAEHDVFEQLEGNGYVGAHVARALLLADRGEHDEAIEIVAQVDQALPDLGTITLLLEWLDVEKASESTRRIALSRIADAGRVGMGRLQLLKGERAAMAPYADLAARLVTNETDPLVLSVGSGTLRRAGRHEEALAAATAAHNSGEESASIALALALRAAGRPDEAAELFSKTFEMTGDPSLLLERARALCEAGHNPEALQSIVQWTNVSGRPPDPECELLKEWVEGRIARDPIAEGRDYDWIRRSAIGHGLISAMTDASTNVLEDPRVKRGTPIRIGVSSLESPSVRLTLALFAHHSTDPASVDYTYASVPTPDPRNPRAPVKTLLWRGEDGVMRQAVDPPSDEVREAVAAVAREAADLFACWEAAGRFAPRFASTLDSVAAAMVYPIDPPDGAGSTPSWVYKSQVAAACIIARADTRWAGSQRRQILIDLLRGPVDWTVAAAVLALGEVAVREPAALAEIRRELQELAKSVGGEGHCPFAVTLAVTSSKIPFFRPELRQKLEEWLRDDSSEPTDGEETDEQKPEAESASDEPSAVSKKPWWKFW